MHTKEIPGFETATDLFSLPPAIAPKIEPVNYFMDFHTTDEKTGKDKYDYYEAAKHLVKQYHIKKLYGFYSYYEARFGIYIRIDKDFKDISFLIERMDHSLSNHQKNEIIGKIRDVVTDIPEESQELSHKIAFPNGTLDTDAWSIAPHSPDNNCILYIPHKYNPSATCEAVDKEIELFTKGNKENQQLLWELFAYPLEYYDNSRKTVVLFIGDSNSGKSVIFRMIMGMLGYTDGVPNFSALQMTDLTGRFDLDSLIWKAANFGSDMALDYIDDRTASALKRISGGDFVRTEKKFKDISTRMLTTKFFFSTNGYFRFSDAGRAMSNRLLVYVTDTKFKPFGDPNRNLLKEISTEEAYEYMVIKSLTALKGLQEHGFSIPGKSMREKINIIINNEPIHDFISHINSLDSDIIGHRLEDTFRMYQTWANGENLKHPFTKSEFKAEMIRAFDLTLKRIGPSDNRGPEVWQYLNPPSDNNTDDLSNIPEGQSLPEQKEEPDSPSEEGIINTDEGFVNEIDDDIPFC